MSQATTSANRLHRYAEGRMWVELELSCDMHAKVYPNINNGVYRCGFAQKQGAYEEAFK